MKNTIKFFILIITFTNILYGKSIFWDKVESIEKNYYKFDIKNSDEKTISELIDKKYDAFNDLLIILKNNPYDLNEQNNFIVTEKEKIKLIQKIKINKQYNYNLAVLRDKIRLDNLKIKEQLYVYFVTLANSWINYKKGDLEKLNKTYLDFLSKIDYSHYFTQYQKLQAIDGKIENDIKASFKEFDTNYLFFNEIIGYIDENKAIFKYETLSNILKLGVLIDTINNNPISSKLNMALRFINLDSARLLLFLITIILFALFDYFIYKKVYSYIKYKIVEQKDELDDIFINNLDKIRKPISILIILIGIKLALEILTYPDILDSSVENLFYIAKVINIVYIFYIIIDNTIIIYLTNKNDDTIRKELVALLVSISKIVIFFIGMLLVLVKYGVDISGILASLGIGGLAVALAAQNTLSNFFGLIKMIADESFSIGDWIQTDSLEGTVVNIGFISTKIRTFDNALITVPNSILANSSIKNWNKRKIGRRIKMHIGVTYSANKKDLQNAISQIQYMLEHHPDIVTSQKVDYKQINKFYKQEQKLTSIDDKYGIKTNLLVYLDKFNDSSIDILIYTFTKTVSWDQWLETKEDILFKIWQILEENNLEFAFPSQSIYIEKQ